jgi:alanine-glyoxylate transaminase/serine-glyoxylate transaminase/serine-pyruvate transaminase
MTISTPRAFPPPERLLLGPGPANIDPRVTAALGAPLLGHLDPVFLRIMEETMADLRRVFRTTNHHTLPMSGTGTAGIEAILLNLIEPDDEVIVGVIGYFGERLAAMAQRVGARVRVLESPPGEIIAPERIEAELKTKPARLVFLVHAETSTGAWQPIAPVAEIAHRYGALIAIDCVTSLGGVPVEIDTWGIDAAASCSQKCIGAPPGLAPVTFGARAMERIRARRGPPPSWYLDVSLLFRYWGEAGAAKERAYHHTAPIASIYALSEALRLVLQEGLELRWRRHQQAQERLVRGLERLGLSLLTPVSHRLPQLSVVQIPRGIDDQDVRRRLLDRGIEIGGGFGPLKGKTWRIGLMGYNARPEAVDRVLAELEELLAPD